jgi:hypothetical protein
LTDLAPLVAEERRLRAAKEAADREAKAIGRAWRKAAATLDMAKGRAQPKAKIAHRRGQPSAPGQRDPRQLMKAHKGFVATLPCLATWIRTGNPVYGVQVAHQRFSLATAGVRNPGLQRKSHDVRCLPLSPAEHALQHRGDELAYWAELGLSGEAVTELGRQLLRVTGDQAAGEDVLIRAVLAAQEIRQRKGLAA